MSRRLLLSVLGSALLIAACSPPSRPTPTVEAEASPLRAQLVFRLSDETFTLPEDFNVYINDTSLPLRPDTTMSAYATDFATAQSKQALYRLPAQIGEQAALLGMCHQRCTPVGFIGDQVLLAPNYQRSGRIGKPVFSGDSTFVRTDDVPGGTQTCSYCDSPEAYIPFAGGVLAYKEAAETLSFISDAPTTTIAVPAPLHALYVSGEHAYLITKPYRMKNPPGTTPRHAIIKAQLRRVSLDVRNPSAPQLNVSSVDSWGAELSDDLVSYPEYFANDEVPMIEHGESLYITFRRSAVVAYNLSTGREQTLPAPFDIPAEHYVAHFLAPDDSHLLALVNSHPENERVYRWHLLTKGPEVWSIHEMSTPGHVNDVYGPVRSGLRDDVYYVSLHNAGDELGDYIGGFDLRGSPLGASFYVYGDTDNAPVRKPIVMNDEIGLVTSTVGGTGAHVFVVDTQGRLFVLNGSDEAQLIETPSPVVSLISLYSTLYVGMAGDDARTHFRALTIDE